MWHSHYDDHVVNANQEPPSKNVTMSPPAPTGKELGIWQTLNRGLHLAVWQNILLIDGARTIVQGDRRVPVFTY
jgi:hypothetical protein